MSTKLDTIYALSTPTGRSGVAVIRASGSDSWAGCKTLCTEVEVDFTHSSDNDLESVSYGPVSTILSTGKNEGKKSGKTAESVQMVSHEAALCKLYGFEKSPDGLKRFLLDEALVLPFQGPASYTGEDVVEYHIHGSKATIDMMLQTLSQLPGHRLAEPGEFTRRAFENGKMDLTKAEAVADLIDAETFAQHQQAMAQMQGGLYRLYFGWSEDLKKALAHLEADIEFPDEDMPDGVAPQVMDAILKLNSAFQEHLQDNRRGERLRDGIKVAIIGAPNAGKSSFINKLSGRDVAIVSEMAGTTRDVLEVHLDLGGYPFIVADTAGLRPDQIDESAQDKIEGEGIRRALRVAEEADLKILLFDGTSDEPDPHTLDLMDSRGLVLINKIDAGPAKFQLDGALEISVLNETGLDVFLERLLTKAQDILYQKDSSMPVLTRARHREALEEGRVALQRAYGADLPELIAEDLRLAVRSLGRITGRVDVEDLLDVIFHDFCIGK